MALVHYVNMGICCQFFAHNVYPVWIKTSGAEQLKAVESYKQAATLFFFFLFFCSAAAVIALQQRRTKVFSSYAISCFCFPIFNLYADVRILL